GGDGSLSGADVFRREWPELLTELVHRGEIEPRLAEAHPHLQIVGLVGSIDNDMFGTDMTIGADTALHRIVNAIDAIASTADSHHRTFVIEVMGRHCGYLALMSGLATGANWVLIPECPPDAEDWQLHLCDRLQASWKAGRRHGIVVVAEGACDAEGRPLTSADVKTAIESRIGGDTRVTILGHVQRGGAPSAFDRNLATALGYTAVQHLLSHPPESEPQLVGLLENRVVTSPLMACVEKTRAVGAALESRDFARALSLRGPSFAEAWGHMSTLLRASPPDAKGKGRRRRLAILHHGGPAPGMNTAVRAAVRLAISSGFEVLGIHNGFDGLREGHVEDMDWMSVHGWVGRGGAELGTSRNPVEDRHLGEIAQRLGELEIEGLLLIGGWEGYWGARSVHAASHRHPEFEIPIACLPATIDNNLPGTEYSVGADTALNGIVGCVDRIKQSAVATRRCFIVEVMGGDCGYLAWASGLATGAERVYIPEEGISLEALREDVEQLGSDFRSGKRLGLVVRAERAESIYTTDFISRLFEKEGGDDFDVRQSVLGHLQEGGEPSPYDRIQATRLVAHAVSFLEEQTAREAHVAAAVGVLRGRVAFTPLERLSDLVDSDKQRPREQPWLSSRSVSAAMSSRPGGQ
ncbi:MAG: 6-phosphofructokinase, partial [Myxococcota bacterium]